MKVVTDLNLGIERGEFVTLLGPSGSGKTTCLMMLAGFENLSGGDILLDGASIGSMPPQKRNIGMVFQSYALFPHMTIAENIAFPLQARGIGKSETAERVAKALAMIRLDSFGGRLPGQLSGGQQQRVALARALVFEPSLVLMDEPLGALDKQLREEMQYEIMHIQQRLGVTVVYVTHDQTEALTMSSRVAVFNGGKIQQLGPPKQIYEEPANSFVARFIGENNRLNGTVRTMDGGACTVDVGDGQNIRAAAINVSAVGEPTMLSIRPERAVIGAAAANAENSFEATIDEIVFHGDHLRMSATLCAQPGFIVKIPNGAGVSVGSPGDRIRIGWAASDCRALDHG
ncbi:ABC transporter ATP-binding protein [Mesorhizobium sp. B2-3-4]|nr:ABC transporter ATP-binding protein [Mesorhizobium sp. B2-3-4]TPM40933.1 ABC transporter ATP-binding protein [Mesorhizobium sp. B2-3-4]